MNSTNIAHPKINLLSPDQIQTIHQRSLDILASTGIRVDSPEAGQIFRSSEGATLKDDRVLISEELIDWAIDSAPSTIEIYNRLGEHIFRIGSSKTRFGIGTTNLYYQDPLTGRIEPFSREHMRVSTRLGSALNQFDLVSTIGILRDISPSTADLYAVLEMIANTYKPLIILASDENLFPKMLDLLVYLHGDINAKPFIIPYFNPISPLILNKGTSDKMNEAINHGLPIIYSNYGMMGMSTPITPAGTLALLNAELLAGLVYSQLIKEGSPIILGSLPAAFDMKDMHDYYSPETALLNIACAEMMAHYSLPHAGTSGSGLGWDADLVAGGWLWFNHLTSLIGKSSLAPFVGGNHGSKVFSPELVVYADDVIDQARSFSNGFTIDDEHIGLDEISIIGPGGDFLMTDLTLREFRSKRRESAIFPRMTLEKWQEAGKPKISTLLKRRTIELIKNASAPDDYSTLIKKGEAYISKLQI